MNPRLVTVDFFESKTQKECENICKELAKVMILLCNVSRNEIGGNDPVYYDDRGLICEAVKSTRSLYLGTLVNLRFWCEKQLRIDTKDKQSKYPSFESETKRQMKKASITKKRPAQIPEKTIPTAEVIKVGTVGKVKGGPKTKSKHRAKKRKAAPETKRILRKKI
ncbi:MAG: hypothetical protein ACFFE6_12580 [Candidatus Thorarchaeota archaeon]